MFRFDNTYPISAPAVQFVVDDTHKAPVHPVRVPPKLAPFVDPNRTPGTIACVLKWACGCMLMPSLVSLISLAQICASILGREGWSPVLTVIAICITIQSMLASCKVGTATTRGTPHSPPLCRRRKNRQLPVFTRVSGLTERVCPRPSDNDRYVPRAPENPKKVSMFPVVPPWHAHHVAQARFHYHGTP